MSARGKVRVVRVWNAEIDRKKKLCWDWGFSKGEAFVFCMEEASALQMMREGVHGRHWQARQHGARAAGRQAASRRWSNPRGRGHVFPVPRRRGRAAVRGASVGGRGRARAPDPAGARRAARGSADRGTKSAHRTDRVVKRLARQEAGV
jgi:hypothetical protein